MATKLTNAIENAKNLNVDASVDSLEVKELKLRSLENTDRLMTNDQKASVISLIAYIIVT